MHSLSECIKLYSYNRIVRFLEKYSRGRRGAPAKGVGRESGARVRIPLSPFLFEIKLKKVLTGAKQCDTMTKLNC